MAILIEPPQNELSALQNLSDSAGFLKKLGDGNYSIDNNNYLPLSGGTVTNELSVQHISQSGDTWTSTFSAFGIDLGQSATDPLEFSFIDFHQVRPFSIDVKGRITSIGVPVNITPPWSAITGKPTTLDGFGIAGGTITGNLVSTSATASTSTTTGAIRAASLGITGAIFAGSLNGNGSGLTSLNASNISVGTLSANRLPDTYLPLAGGTVTGVTNFSLGLSVRSQGFEPLQLINLAKEAGLSTSYAFYNMKSTDAGGLGQNCFSIYTYISNGNVKSIPFVILDNDNVGIGTTNPSQKLDVGGSAKATSFVVGTNQVVSARRTGWAAPTGTATRTTFAPATVTLPQLAERVKALIDDLMSHGLIGA
ncbi:hypothetical protein NIES204_38280 [Planktothrix agardhii NIES-204]|nr:hypothetical protein NIES204_38280 [Planktothrix agardhii NIES-204]